MLRPLILLAAVPLFGAGTVADITRGIREGGLDPQECYRVRELTLAREDIRLYLTEGYLIFGKPVAGRRMYAVFSAEVEGGEGEVLLMPPTRGERRSMASYTGSPNLDEHFRAAVLVFSDTSYETLMEQVRANPFNKKEPDFGLLAAEKWGEVTRNLAGSFETRFAQDLLSGTPPAQGFLCAVISGKKLGNFDVLYDPRLVEQIAIGQLAVSHENRAYYDIWASFQARSWRNGRSAMQPSFTVDNYRIDATLDADLALAATVKVKIRPGGQPERVLPFDLTRDMRVTAATLDGRPAEVLQRDSLRANLLRDSGNDLILVVPAEPLAPGREYELEIREEGRVVHDAGNHVYFVGSRGNWYPNRRMQFASYDLTFRYPQELDLVTPGQIVFDRSDGAWRTTHRRTAAPIRFAGFNLGHYERVRVSRGGYAVEVCANRSLEKALERPRNLPVIIPAPPPWRQKTDNPVRFPPDPGPSSPSRARLQELATEVASAMEFMSARFGPPPLSLLTVSPVPGAFGQGFAGLLYISTLSYLQPRDKPVESLNSREQLFFTDVLQAHETAHQWWGNVVTSAGYHDDWLMEALANYSALLYVERRRGAKSVESLLDSYKQELLKKSASGDTVESVGPIVLGARLASSLEPHGYQTITYGKGSWILHMLRRQMGDQQFFAMLAELRRRYQWKGISTEEFRALAAKFLPPKSPDPELSNFFDQWVYGTGIPSLKLTYAVKGKGAACRVEGKVTQGDAGEDFSVPVPIEIQFARGKPLTRIVQTGGGAASFTVALRQAPVKVVLDPGGAVLRR